MTRSEAGRLGYLKAKQNPDFRAAINALRRSYADSPKNCGHCLKPIPYAKRFGKFCTQSCAASHNNSRRTKTKECLHCGTPVPIKGVYCKQACQIEYEYRQRVSQWLAGTLTGGTWSGVKGFVRRWLIETFGEKCHKCGWDERNPYSGRIPIQTDHLDGDPGNHAPDNVRLTCLNCHSLTPSFGGLNRGKGRRSRSGGMFSCRR